MFRHVFRSGSDRCIALAAGAVHSFTARRGERIVCRGGRILLSQFDVADDFDLSTGTDIVVHKHGLVVVEAIEPSVIAMHDAQGSLHCWLRRSGRNVDYFADNVRLRDKAPIATVLAVIAIITKHKIMPGRH